MNDAISIKKFISAIIQHAEVENNYKTCKDASLLLSQILN